ncbi:MAG: sensor histidine kinase, partial [Oscillospiraceae bacterium]
VSVIQNYAAAMKKKNLSEQEREEYSNTIINASQRLSELITNILKLNKLDNQEIVPIAEPYDVSAQLAACAVQFVDIFEKKGIAFEADFEDEAIIYADESMMEIVWNNLLSNAAKFTEPGGTIALRQVSDAEGVTVSVADTGCGMTQEVAKRVFDKFYQGDTSHASQGNGLGLALALRVIQRVNGTISVESKVGKGTTFTVKIPRKQ